MFDFITRSTFQVAAKCAAASTTLVNQLLKGDIQVPENVMRYAFAGLGVCGGDAFGYFAFRDNESKRDDGSSEISAKWNYNWDRREPQSFPEPLGMKDDSMNEHLDVLTPWAVRNIFLIRHGQYERDGLTDYERRLTEIDCKQAEYTGKRLISLGIPVTKLVASTMARAEETADIIAHYLAGVPRDVSVLLREGVPVPPEPPVGHKLTCYPDGARMEEAFQKYFHRASVSQLEDSYEILVCHSNLIRYLLCRALQFPTVAWQRLSLNHASITWLAIKPNGHVVLRCLGDSGHLPPYLVTR